LGTAVSQDARRVCGLRAKRRHDKSLPPEAAVDAIVERLVEKMLSVAEIVAIGFDRAVVKKVEHLLYPAEYKCFLSAPGVRLTQRAFWLDRCHPVVNLWREDGCALAGPAPG
jgi:NAD+ synthase